jgi:ribosome-binding protein aMBF1 (putative translation factor)
MDTVPPHFGVAIKAGRYIRGWSVRTLSAKSTVPPWRISAFERGRAVPEGDEFALLWHALTSDPPSSEATP